MVHCKTYNKSHYRNAEDLYHDLNWLVGNGVILSLHDTADAVMVVFKTH